VGRRAISTTVGKIFSELKTFVIAGHAKQFLKSLYYRERTTFVQWAFAFIGAALEYSLQNAINFAHDPERLKEKLSPEGEAIEAAAEAKYGTSARPVGALSCPS